MKHRFSAAWLALGCLTLTLPPEGRAELPPAVYAQEHRQAPYALELLVRSVHRTGSVAAGQQLQVVAQVLEVKRQPAGARLKPGDQIRLSYGLPPARPQGWAGPSPVPPLEPGERVPAWLSPDPAGPGRFQPAAGGRSFGPSLEAVVEPTP
ncbi:hypothetical protein CB0101_00500 [Synechococcus sp. CB0101]|uniref:hypothetical protein n=1 Tax=Synechococcus sp. CB0101 TaxID=232348 RepID=UPI0002002A94|nr:hypothetical protein [Synechococcus sp. CB0101]QCH13609.1 hypothetical protein CB0101_00500 [Synechococcus sp. CB0101]